MSPSAQSYSQLSSRLWPIGRENLPLCFYRGRNCIQVATHGLIGNFTFARYGIDMALMFN